MDDFNFPVKIVIDSAIEDEAEKSALPLDGRSNEDQLNFTESTSVLDNSMIDNPLVDDRDSGDLLDEVAMGNTQAKKNSASLLTAVSSLTVVAIATKVAIGAFTDSLKSGRDAKNIEGYSSGQMEVIQQAFDERNLTDDFQSIASTAQSKANDYNIDKSLGELEEALAFAASSMKTGADGVLSAAEYMDGGISMLQGANTLAQAVEIGEIMGLSMAATKALYKGTLDLNKILTDSAEEARRKTSVNDLAMETTGEATKIKNDSVDGIGGFLSNWWDNLTDGWSDRVNTTRGRGDESNVYQTTINVNSVSDAKRLVPSESNNVKITKQNRYGGRR